MRNSYLKYGGIFLISIILFVLMFSLTDDEEIDLLEKKEKENSLESLEIENQDLLISQSEEEFGDESLIKNDLSSNGRIIDD